MRVNPEAIVLEGQKGYMEAALLSALGTDGLRNFVLAWARYANYLNVDLV